MIDLYIYDQNLSQIAYNDWGKGCKRWLSQITISLYQGTHIIGVTGYGTYDIDYGHYFTSISCTGCPLSA